MTYLICLHHITYLIMDFNLGYPLESLSPSFLRDYHCNLIESTIHPSNSNGIQAYSQSKYPLSSIMSYHNFYSTHKQYIINVSSISEPHTYEDAICHENWKIKLRLNSLLWGRLIHGSQYPFLLTINQFDVDGCSNLNFMPMVM